MAERRVVLITGASDGIGAELARRCAVRGRLRVGPAECGGAVSVATCARLILEAALARRREVVTTAKGRHRRWMKRVAPGLIDRLARQALRQDCCAPPDARHV
jgi:NAD(P)-dependent dehydrogenase (short-subunit alcohol dehydrogenase family)